MKNVKLLALLTLLLSGCIQSTPIGVGSLQPTLPSTALVIDEDLQTNLAQLLTGSEANNALWGVQVQSTETGELFFSLNPRRLIMPASNMKIITAAVAAERLGWDYRYETQLVATGAIKNGQLQGDLIIRGNGDPTIASLNGKQNGVFEAWINQLQTAGIRKIYGRIIGDDDAFDDERLADGWTWNDLAYGYATAGGALQYHGNVVELEFHAGIKSGMPVSIKIRPKGSGLELINNVITSPIDGEFTLSLHRLPGQPTLEVRGRVPASTNPFIRTAAVDNPTEFFVRAFRTMLISKGIEVSDIAVDIDTLSESFPASGSIGYTASNPTVRNLISHHSPPLFEIVTVLMKESQNLYAETLLKTIGSGQKSGTAEAGRDVVREVLKSWGIDDLDYIISDGSGLSRYNYVTAEVLNTVLQRMRNDSRHKAAFESSLPIAGRDGTLKNRMLGTRAEGNVRAKTGSMSNVRGLSGYVTTRDGEVLVFTIIANNFSVPAMKIDNIIDQFLNRLANFSRH